MQLSFDVVLGNLIHLHYSLQEFQQLGVKILGLVLVGCALTGWCRDLLIEYGELLLAGGLASVAGGVGIIFTLVACILDPLCFRVEPILTVSSTGDGGNGSNGGSNGGTSGSGTGGGSSGSGTGGGSSGSTGGGSTGGSSTGGNSGGTTGGSSTGSGSSGGSTGGSGSGGTSGSTTGGSTGATTGGSTGSSGSGGTAGGTASSNTGGTTGRNPSSTTGSSTTGSTSGGQPPGVPKIYIDPTKYLTVAEHVREAQAAGHPRLLTIDRPGSKARRDACMRSAGEKPKPGLDRDEYPPAMFREGGAGCSVKHVSIHDNRGAGASVQRQTDPYLDGTVIEMVVGIPP